MGILRNTGELSLQDMQVSFMIFNKTRKETKKLKKRGREVAIYFPFPQEENSYSYSLSALSEGVPVQKSLEKIRERKKTTVPIKYVSIYGMAF